MCIGVMRKCVSYIKWLRVYITSTALLPFLKSSNFYIYDVMNVIGKLVHILGLGGSILQELRLVLSTRMIFPQLIRGTTLGGIHFEKSQFVYYRVTSQN